MIDAEARDAIATDVVDTLDARRLAHGHQHMSSRERSKLIRTTQYIIDRLDRHERGRTLPAEFRKELTDQAQSYYRDEWYEVDHQVDYVNRLRNHVIRSLDARGSVLDTILDFFDTLTFLTMEACRRPLRYEWPLLVVVGYGHLARTKLTQPLKDLLPNTPFDLWIVDVRDEALDEARKQFHDLPVRILTAGEAQAAFSKYPAATKIVYVATDSNSHLPVVKAYADSADVIAIEKPLCSSEKDLDDFLKLKKTPKRGLVVVDHYSLRRASLIVEGIKKRMSGMLDMTKATKITFRMLEANAVDDARAAAHEGVIFDMLPHVFPFVLALATADLRQLKLKSAEWWKYESAPAEWGETFVHAVFEPRKGPLIESFAGKGVERTEKEVVIEGEEFHARLDLIQGKVTGLNRGLPFEFGASNRDLGYGFVIHELLNAPALGFLGLDEGVEIVRILARTKRAAKNRGTYAVGTMPSTEKGSRFSRPKTA